jgi:hypothetical protein
VNKLFNHINGWFFLRQVLLNLFAIVFVSCQNQENSEEGDNKKNEIIQKGPIINRQDIQSKIFLNHDSVGGWGYDIVISNVKYIHQTNIPAINGKNGFGSKQDAQKAADLVINKIKKNIMPPAITLEELDSLQITK